jgi:hypothetical protein
MTGPVDDLRPRQKLRAVPADACSCGANGAVAWGLGLVELVRANSLHFGEVVSISIGGSVISTP